MSEEYPEIFARFYDLIYQHLRDGVDNQFFLNEIKQADGAVLEIGVGTGRFFTDALSTGADIYGFDISEPMINVLLGKLDENQAYRISIQDIRNFSYDFGFDLIIAPFRVIMHLADKADQIRALNNVFRHLNPGGKFIFDAFVPDLKQLISGLENQTDFEGEYEPGRKLKRIVSTKPELARQLIHVTFRLEWEEDGGNRQKTWTVPLRYYFRYELEHLVERSDFEDYQILGDYHGSELDENSKEFIVYCRK